MFRLTVQVVGGQVGTLDIEVDEEGVTVRELKDLLGKRLGPTWQYCGLLVDGRNADYLGDERIKGGNVHVIVALPQIQGASS